MYVVGSIYMFGHISKYISTEESRSQSKINQRHREYDKQKDAY